MNFLPQSRELSCPCLHGRVTKEADLNLPIGWLPTCRHLERWLLRVGNGLIERSEETLLRPDSFLQQIPFLPLIFIRDLPNFSTNIPNFPHTDPQSHSFPEPVRDQTPHQLVM